MQCPRCNTINAPEARFCRECGLSLHKAAATQANLPAAQPASPPHVTLAPVSPTLLPVPSRLAEAPPLSAGAASIPPYPYSPVAGHSILQKLNVRRPATVPFWFGLFGLIAALLCCPASVAIILLGSEGRGIEDPAGFRTSVLTFSACTFFAAVLVAGFFLFIGRPRRTL